MPRRTDIRKILIIGSGPIIIGQACEFDYSGTQACKALKKLGYEIVLVNSNPATIMTDPAMADVTYIEPLTAASLTEIIEKERPDALLPNLGGQTGLNLSSALARDGILEKYGVKVIGVNVDAIKRGEDRQEFKNTMARLGLDMPRSDIANSLEEAIEVVKRIGFPVVIRPAYTLGGTGGGFAYNLEEFQTIVSRGLSMSLVRQVLVEESVLGWEELELEVVRDAKGQKITVCFIENVDAMGVHTGDSFCTAPMLTIAPELQDRLQRYSYDIVDAIEVIGGTNIQFAHDPSSGRVVVIEINPRTSRSSALASKATGFPIAFVSSLLACGLTLDEIPYWRDGSLEKYTPSGDYVVVKFARWAFEKFRGVQDRLGTQMRAVGEVMSIGKTYKEAFQKSIRSLETGRYGLGFARDFRRKPLPELMEMLSTPSSERQFLMYEALRKGADTQALYERTHIKPWFIEQMRELVALEERLLEYKGGFPPDDLLVRAKRDGFADRYLSQILGVPEAGIREKRTALGVFEAWDAVPVSGVENAAYYYSTYNGPDRVKTSDRRKVLVLGGGPNRIGQGIEFDYCCVHGAFALREEGFETIMVNCNPETVSTDYDTSDRLYFEPLTKEDVLAIIEAENPFGVIVQFGGQTPLKLAVPLEREGVPIIGTSPDSIDRAEDRERFKDLLDRLDLKQPPNGIARSAEEAAAIALRIGYPVLLRPSYVLGGRAMEILHDEAELHHYLAHAVQASEEKPLLIDKFLEDAVEIDVDAIADGETVVIGGVMEHIEEAGVHSGDSACSLPTHSITGEVRREIIRQAKALAKELRVVGLMNVQFAVKKGEIFILEVNPRASRTVPFVSKAIGIPLAKLAAKIMVGRTLAELGFTEDIVPDHISVKEAVFPFIKFPDVDTILGPEMRSTGEVMGIDSNFGRAFAKSQIAAGMMLPREGKVFVSVRDADKAGMLPSVRMLRECGFRILATGGTADFLNRNGIPAEPVRKINEGRPHVADLIKNGEIALVINTPLGAQSKADSYYIRRTALVYNIPYVTTLAAARAVAHAILHLIEEDLTVRSLQEYHGTRAQPSRKRVQGGETGR